MKIGFGGLDNAAISSDAFKQLVLGRPVQLGDDTGTIEEARYGGLRIAWKSGRTHPLSMALDEGLTVDVDPRALAEAQASGFLKAGKPGSASQGAIDPDAAVRLAHAKLSMTPAQRAIVEKYTTPGPQPPEAASAASDPREARKAELRAAVAQATGKGRDLAAVPAGQEARAEQLRRAGQIASTRQ